MMWEWATAHPWMTFWMFVLLVVTIENVALAVLKLVAFRKPATPPDPPTGGSR